MLKGNIFHSRESFVSSAYTSRGRLIITFSPTDAHETMDTSPQNPPSINVRLIQAQPLSHSPASRASEGSSVKVQRHGTHCISHVPYQPPLTPKKQSPQGPHVLVKADPPSNQPIWFTEAIGALQLLQACNSAPPCLEGQIVDQSRLLCGGSSLASLFCSLT